MQFVVSLRRQLHNTKKSKAKTTHKTTTCLKTKKSEEKKHKKIIQIVFVSSKLLSILDERSNNKLITIKSTNEATNQK